MGGPRQIAAAAALAVALLSAGSTAHAAIPQSLRDSCAQRDAADGDVANGVALPYWLCDDGVPDAGGRDPNVGGLRAITVPASYQGFEGLPAKAPDAATVPGAEPTGDIALDVDVSLPDPGRYPPPPGGYPLVVFMHGCCTGDKTSWEAATVDGRKADGSVPAETWHYSNAYFASQGYAVVTYTARGFVEGKGPTDPNGNGSTGETQIDHRAFEINDFQHLTGQLVDAPFSVGGATIAIDPRRVVATGGSYGGGFAWLALTDPEWQSPGGTPMRLVAAAPRYGWSDLLYSLVPNGTHLEDGPGPAADGSTSSAPIGFPKRSIVTALYVTGQQGATFPRSIDAAFVCLQSPLPIETNPQCAGVREQVLPSFVFDRSAYYQNTFFDRLAAGTLAPVPVFSAGTTTDPLFPGLEHRRIVRRLERARPGYPVQEYYGDYQHFVQNKRKEWADLCGPADGVCALDRYPGGDPSAEPAGLTRRGVSTRLTRFVDHYARPPGNPDQAAPGFDVTAALQVCPQNASGEFPVDQPGERFTAPSFAELAPNTLRIDAEGTQRTSFQVEPNTHALLADPLQNLATRSGRCPLGPGPAGPGVATYDSPQLPRSYTMIGPTRVSVPYEATGSGELQLNARLYDVFPGGTAVMVDRGFRSLTESAGTARLDLLGNGWRFERGHRVRVELAQDDDPYVKASTVPSTMELAGVTLELPVREASARLGSRLDRSRARRRRRGDDREGAGGGRRDGGGGGGEAEVVSSASGELPFTGFPLLPPVAAGLGLLVAGAALRRVSRRRYLG
ncbi:MAG: S15 peptidase family protein [Thermoleophilaceae bacterium]